MKVTVHTVSAFAKTAIGGNAAGVVFHASHLSTDDMLTIAHKTGFSETVFVEAGTGADYRLRFFTPNSEIDLCGHATIAAFSLLQSQGILHKKRYSVETRQSMLEVDIMENGLVFMEQPLPVFYDMIPAQEISECLNISLDVIKTNLPIQIVSTGVRDIFVPLHHLQALFSIKPNSQAITSISRKYNVIGFHVFTIETMLNSTAHCRNFAPLYDIPEESATGTSSGALGCYLLKYGMISSEQAKCLIFEQGYVLNKPSEILVRLSAKQNKIMNIQVGGMALVTEDISIEI